MYASEEVALPGTIVGPRIVGRERELAVVEEFLGEEGDPQALVLVGEPGIGKTTVWEAGVAKAAACGLCVLDARASEPELRLSFVALADLLEEVETAALASIPAPQLHALEVALLRTGPGETPPEPFAVSAGFTSTLRILAAERPLLVAVDDVPWLDASSAEALLFASRRLGGHAVRFLLARRPGKPTELERAFGSVGLRRVDLAPLSLGATRSLLAERLGLTLPRRVLRRVFESTGGNPLFALELGRLLLERGTPELGADLPIPELVDDLFGERIAGLARPVRRALLAVSLSGGLTLRQLTIFVDPLSVEGAVASGLLVLDGERVRVSHPLLAAASRKQSTARERRGLHLDLARTVGDETLRAHHLALASATPDAALADTVAEAAANAIARGAAHDAVEVAEQALRLTPADYPERSERLLDLAHYLVIAGELPRARELLEGKVDELPPGATKAKAYLRLAECSKTIDEELQLLEHALAQSEGEPALRAAILATKSTTLAAGLFRRLHEADALAREALEAAAAAGPEEERWALSALAWIRLLRGFPVDDLCERFESAPQGSSLYDNSIERVAGIRMTCRGEMHEARVLFGQLRRLAEERGEARSGWWMHHGLTTIETRSGNVEAAERLMAQSDEWSAFEDVEEIRAHRMAIIEAVRGRPEEAERWAAETIVIAGRGAGTLLEELEAWRSRGLVALLRHEPERAVEALRPIWEHMCREGIDDPGVSPMAPDLVEALVELGELEEAEAVTDRLERLSREQEHPWGLASVNRCRALLAAASAHFDEGGADLLRQAAADYGEIGMLFDQARSLLLLGRHGRRHRKRALARASLEQAVAIFDSLGGTGWAEEARAELERVGGRRPDPEGSLTAAEERVARLAADGLSNKQIAAGLYVSISTVEKHLSHVYEKLGVRTRGQLARRLTAPA